MVHHRDYCIVEVEADDGHKGIGFCYVGSGGGPLVALLPRQPGAREPRWAHLLCGAPAPELLAEAGGAGLGIGKGTELATQLAALAERVQALEQQVQDLQQRLEQAGV